MNRVLLVAAVAAVAGCFTPPGGTLGCGAGGATGAGAAAYDASSAGSWKLVGHAICVAPVAVPGHEIVRASTPSGAAPAREMSVACPTGKRPTAAGWAAFDPSNAAVDASATYSLPAGAPGWLTRAKLWHSSNFNWRIDGAVVCTS